jgi:hypothetical protein
MGDGPVWNQPLHRKIPAASYQAVALFLLFLLLRAGKIGIVGKCGIIEGRICLLAIGRIARSPVVYRGEAEDKVAWQY